MPNNHNRARIILTHRQAEYLRVLLIDDLEGTDLTTEEREAATVLLSRTKSVCAKYQKREAS